MDEILKQRDELHKQLTSLQNEYEQMQQENKALNEEVCLSFLLFSSIFFLFFLDKIQR
jgi:membrane protein insertase Oxa1/YidC/SpoIIIJ